MRIDSGEKGLTSRSADSPLFAGRRPYAFVWRSSSPCEILGFDLLDVELGGMIAHGLQHLFKRRGFAFYPAQWVDTRHHERPQVRTDQTALLQLLHHCRNLLFQVEHQRSAFLMVLNSGSQRLISKDLKSPQNRVVDAATKTWRSFIADPERHQRGFVEIEPKLRFGSGGVLVNQAAVDAYDFQRAFFEVMGFLGIQSEDLPRHFTIG